MNEIKGRSKFAQAVVRVVKAVPMGKVVSYGQVAVYVGVPRGARAVGWVLRIGALVRSVDMNVPWWRVVNNTGRISIKDNWEHDAIEQRERLIGEGVEVAENYVLDMLRYRFIASEEELKKFGLEGEYLRFIWEKFRVGY